MPRRDRLPKSIAKAFARTQSSWRELAQAIPDIYSHEFWIWANRYGLFAAPELRAILAPFPAALPLTGSIDASERQFASSGARYYDSMEQVLLEHDRSWGDMRAVLDFGCGEGRIARLFARFRGQQTYYGFDLRETAIEGLKQQMGFGDFRVSSARPPLPLAGGSLDAIFSISVFSHLRADAQAAWLREFHRLLRPDGILFQTVHGRHAMALCEHYDVWRNALDVTPQSFVDLREGFANDGFAWVPNTLNPTGSEDYGTSFQSDRYIRDTWGDDYDLLGVWPGQIDSWQDLVAMRKRSRLGKRCEPVLPVLSTGGLKPVERVELVRDAVNLAVGRPLQFRVICSGGENVHFQYFVKEGSNYFTAIGEWTSTPEFSYTPWLPDEYNFLVHAASGPGPHAVPSAVHGLKVIV